MLEKSFVHISRDTRQLASKALAILLTISLSMMTWNAASISTAFAGENDESLTVTDDTLLVDGDDTQSDGEEVTTTPESEPPAESESAADPESAAEEPEASEPEAPAVDEDAEADSEAAQPEAAADEEAEETAGTLNDSYDGVAVTVSDPNGTLPADTELVLGPSSVTKEDAQAAFEDEIVDFKAVDISFVDKDGKPVKPAENVKVTLSGATVASGQTLHVLHGTEPISATIDGGSATFETKDFSPYALVVTSPVNDKAKLAATRDAKAGEDEATEEGGEEAAPETWTVTFYDRNANVVNAIEVVKGEAIGDLPDVPYYEDNTGVWYVGSYDNYGTPTYGEGPISSTYIPTENTSIIPKYELINYTVTFYTDETKSKVVDTRTVNADSNYGVNDMPTVPTKTGYSSKWVYSGGDFDNTVAVSGDTDVWADYTQNTFTVTYMVESEPYQTDTYYYGDVITSEDLPSDPAIEGKQFIGWRLNDAEFTGGEVKSNLTVTAEFESEYKVSFTVEDTGEVLSQYYRNDGEAIGTMPQNPFVAGKVFEKWVDSETGEEVTAATVVNGDMTVVAQFRTIDIYNIKAEYYYLNDRGEEVIFNTDLIQTDKLPYTITAPASTQTDSTEVSGGPVYYATNQVVEVAADDFDGDTATVRIEYVEHTAEYDFVYMLKNLDGNGYTEIDRTEDVKGVLHSTVTPTVKSYDYAAFESAETAEITQATGQEVHVYYTRKNFPVSYDSTGGSYVAGATVPYGTEYTVSSADPTRDGYTFEGWYLDEACTKAAGSTVTVNGETTLYANWEGDEVDYTIVYMFEKYNDTGTQSSYVYDNSRTGTGTVGTTVQASSAPSVTRTGWEVDTTKNASSSVVIAADGSSVLYVYYKLTEYTMTFDRNHQSRVSDYIIRPNGTTTTNTYSFNVKLGQDISSLWPSAGSNYYSFMGWQKNGQGTRYVTKQLIMNTDLLPSSGKTQNWKASWGNAYTFTVNYYLQNADDDGYTRSETYSQTYNADSYGITPKVISGYTFDHGNNEDYTFTYNLYYNRNTYTIDYYYGSTRLDTISNVKFDANINKAPYIWTPTAEQCGVDSDYTFAGWYADSGLTTPYNFSTMPASNLVLYAKWTPPTFDVTFVDGEDASTVYSTVEDVAKYSMVSAPSETPSKDGYVFDGWYTTADGSELFQWTTQITENTTIYAHWTPKTLSYTVKYVDQAGNDVASPKTITNPTFTVGQEITEQAVAVAGFRPQDNSMTLSLSGNDTDNVITFVYIPKSETTSYKVRYVIADGETGAGTAVAAEKNLTGVPGDTTSVIELAAAVDYDALYEAVPELNGVEFFPDAVEKELVLAADEAQNVLTFYYSSFKNVKVTVNYVDMNGDPIPGMDSHTEVLKVGKTFTLARTPIAGWELYAAVEGSGTTGTAAGSSYKITDEVAAGDGLTFTLVYQKKATITVNSQSRTYNGEVLTLPAALNDQVTVEGLLDSDTLTALEYTYTNADAENGRRNAGTATVTPKNATIIGKGATNSNYYKVRYISGTLEVTKINVTVRIEPDRWTGAKYNGTEYKAGFTNSNKRVEDYILISDDGYANAHRNDIWNTIKGLEGVNEGGAGLGYYGIAKTDAGDYTYNIGFTDAMLPEDNNYSVNLFVRSGRLQILPAELTVTTGSAEKAYDGTALTKDEASLRGLVAADEGKATVAATGTITDPGSAPNSYTITWGDVNPSNYTIKENLGTLTVTEATLNVTVADKTVTYNGEEQNGYAQTDSSEYTVTGLANGHTLNIEYTPAKGTDAGTYENGSFAETFTVTDADDKDVTEYYTLGILTPGKLTIEKLPVVVTIVGEHETSVYDGITHGVSGFTAEADNSLSLQSTNVGVTALARAAESGVGHEQMAEHPFHFGPFLLGPLDPEQVRVPVQI
ncbi:Internalin-A precursor [Slackia heliotrinireducens]|uniref:Conserved repeat protein n=1 Tax=Slackia heliotrinireducens (strain ATCC 29202 / DSM 20476 / NCTC 11029 / RHS 1) TaxID=471855 RepID=C7N5J8_SLAHD|nr:conserved repeat protein [Slackia heliotrinireducens DSM 20476]VEH00268.1 Internalin-A precursor [Slackia heliotrinireducens]